MDEEHLLGPFYLKKQGVETALDGRGPRGARKLSRFDFTIEESQVMGSTPPAQQGYVTERRFGIPIDPEKRVEYVENWAAESINPNKSHLLVFTFYEAELDDDVLFSIIGEEEFHLQNFQLPKRRIRRVICRAMIHPSGIDPSTGEIKSFWSKTWGQVTKFATEWLAQVSGWVNRVLVAIARFPLNAASKTSELACVGMGKVDELTSLGDVAGPAPAALVDQFGRLRINAAVQSRSEGTSICHRVSTPRVSTCETGTDVIFQGRCVRLPEFKLRVASAEFIRPPSAIEYDEFRVEVPPESYYASLGERGVHQIVDAIEDEVGSGGASFREIPDLGGASPPVLDNWNRGLTRVYLDWESRWDHVDPDLHDQVRGFAVVVHPDQRSSSRSVPRQGFTFFLPKWVATKYDDEEDGFVHRNSFVDGFAVGGLDYYPEEDGYTAGDGSDSVVHHSPGVSEGKHIAIASKYIRDNYDYFNDFIHNLPLAPGFTHGFQVRPYAGEPGESNFSMGPLSETLWLSGDDVACDLISRDSGVGDGFDDPADIQLLYDCPHGRPPAALGYTDDEFRPGILALTGTDICDDIFSSTPAGFTWDNPVVRGVWGLAWIIAGALFFTLWVWQGLRMTYDIWLDPRPAVGFRELIPRFILALILAWGSLFICQAILVVASDLTCFVAQFTGMSMLGGDWSDLREPGGRLPGLGRGPD